MPIAVNAASAKVDWVNIEIDVPVDGVKLPQKVSVDFYCDAQNAYFPSANPPMKVDNVSWYKVNTATPLSKDYKAKLGESYTLTVVLVPQNGFECASALQTANNKINNMSAFTNLYGSDYWTFSADFTTIPSVGGKPVISVKKLNLTPYEGEPVEIMIEATGTNLKYQWQMGWTDGSWSPMVDIDDNAAYSGSKTNHFKIHTFFGDTFDENELDVRCRVTGDNGETYSQVFNFTFIDRTVVNAIDINGVSTPTYGNTPKYTATTSSSEYNATSVEWYGPKGADGQYTKMNSSSRFVNGEYYCRIHITPDTPYKFDENTSVRVNGINQNLITIDGSTLNPYQTDKYYVDVHYTVEKEPDLVNRLSANVVTPVDGALPNNYVTPAGEGYKTTDVDWSYYDKTDDDYYIMPDGMKFEAGKTYECAVQFEALDEYIFADNKANMTGFINGYKGVISPVYSNKKAYVTVKFTVPNTKALLGDANSDGEVNILDATLVQTYVAKYKVEDINLTNADVNKDGIISIQDATAIQMFVAKMISNFDNV